MADPIYLIKTDKQAVRMEPTPYETEKEFQEVLKRFPELLAGEQIDREDPRRWLLVAREMGVPDSEAAGARWSLDHFFVDQDGIPTEVRIGKTASRQVLGSMTDFANLMDAYRREPMHLRPSR